MPHSAWLDPLNEAFTPTHMDDATYEALIDHSDDGHFLEEMMLPVSNVIPS